MRNQPTLAIVVSTVLLSALAAQAQPADPDDGDVLASTEEWTEADVNDDGTLSQAEWNRAEPSLSAHFGEIDADDDRRISRDELAAWQAGPDPGDVDADELATGAAARDAPVPATEDKASTPGDTTDALLPDDGDEATELLPDDADDAAGTDPASQ